ncbi:MAG: hypothetical protein J6T01_00220 [Kiritimatiellae bacterium]|nr:hypothetical protein [Kiritimatiellia bacterium]
MQTRADEAIDAMAADFADPPMANRAWTYWFWCNSLTDRETVAEEAKDIAELGFGGVLLTDSRGYWIDDEHVINPPPEIEWGGEEWLGLVEHAVRSCAANGIAFSMNIAASGGHLRGQIDAKGDNPKILICRRYRPGQPFERPASPYFRDVAVFAVRTAAPQSAGEWRATGDGVVDTAAGQSKRMDDAARKRTPALEVRELNSAAEGAGLGADWTIVRFGSDIIHGRPEDIDILDPLAVRRHLDRTMGRLCARLDGLCGTNRTFRYIYNVSWEGMMPTWSPTFEADYRRIIGRGLRPSLPILAGFDLPDVDSAAVIDDYRRSRGEMMVANFYATVREWAHERGMGAIAESGGPWTRTPETFGRCDQLKFLAANDIPQGEFWPLVESKYRDFTGHANANGHFLVRGPVHAAAAYGRNIVSVEAFTHMHRHYSVDPAYLKPVGDQAFADGVNLMVWHTYTTSPKSKYGTPGNEYFAGSHINRHVTWHDDFAPFVRYLGRCQTLLQRGRPVADVAVRAMDGAYVHWGCGGPGNFSWAKDNGRLRNTVSGELDVRIPKGYDFDLLNEDAIAKNPKLLERYRIVFDARPPAKLPATVDVGSLKPDVETSSDWTWRHRRDGSTDIYFLAGEGEAKVIFRAAAPAVEIWDALTSSRRAADAVRLADGRTKVRLSLPVGGSAFVLFLPDKPSYTPAVRLSGGGPTSRLHGPWAVSFAYHKWITAEPPKARRFDKLEDFTTVDDLKHFAGTATYRTCVKVDDAASLPTTLSLGEVPTGLARVFVNGKDCGVAWCAPWQVDIASAVRRGDNAIEIRYTNNWYNRLVGDCFLPPDKRVTRSVLHYWNAPNETKWPCSGPNVTDKLQPSGLLGPVSLICGKAPETR